MAKVMYDTVVLKPNLKSRTLEMENGTYGAALYRILANAGYHGVLTLKDHGQYVKGLADAHVHFASELLGLLQKADSVTVELSTEQRDR